MNYRYSRYVLRSFLSVTKAEVLCRRIDSVSKQQTKANLLQAQEFLCGLLSDIRFNHFGVAIVADRV